jgi:hypothetical protein
VLSGHTTEAQTDVDVGSPAKSTTSADAGGTVSSLQIVYLNACKTTSSFCEL